MQNLATDILACEARIAANRGLAGLLSRGRETEALRRERLVVKADTVLRQVELLSLLWDVEDEKAGFRPDQPRHPRGSGPISGRWSGGAGTGSASPSTRGPRPSGHHYVPRGVFGKYLLPAEAREVLERATTGPLKKRHGYNKKHRKYNLAVSEHFKRFLRENGIRPERMTADQARRLVESVRNSTNPRIRNFNLEVETSRRTRLGTGSASPSTRGPRPSGHHYVPRGVFGRYPLPAEARGVLERATTGPLEKGHGYNKKHRIYNLAVSEHFKRFLRENGIRPERMTADQARRLVESVRNSRNPRIRNFNLEVEMSRRIRRVMPKGD